MNLLIEKPDRAAKLGKMGRQIAEKKFSPKRFNLDLVEFLKKLMI